MGKNRFDAVIFDLGSTLIHFDAEWTEVLPLADLALLRSLQNAGLDLDDRLARAFRARMDQYYRERDKEFIEFTTLYVLRSLLAEWGFSDVPETVLRQALSELHAVTQAHWQTEADALPTLQTLKSRGYHLGLISNAGDDADVQTLIDKAGVRPYFDIILTSAMEGIRKPDPRIFQKVLDFWELPPSRVAMVGDLLGADILGAQSTGIFGIWITRRSDTPINQASFGVIQPDAEIAALEDLPMLLGKL